MKLLAESGTPFFVSVKPGILTEVQEEELKQAYYDAASNMEQAIPLDWKKRKRLKNGKRLKGFKDLNGDKSESRRKRLPQKK